MTLVTLVTLVTRLTADGGMAELEIIRRQWMPLRSTVDEFIGKDSPS